MVMKYILIRKNVKENTMYLSSVFRSELGDIFSNLSKDAFEIDLEGNTYTLNYRFSNKKNDVYHLYIEFQTSPAKEAEVLNEVNKKLNGPNIKKKFNLIVAYDEVSEYYCGKISQKFGKSERLLRELIFLIMIKTFGAEWGKKTIAKEMLDNVKASAGGLNEAQIVETVLYEMTIAQLEDYLFKPYSGLEKNPELEEEFNKVDINELSEIEKANWLKIMQKRSLWDDYFVDYGLDVENMQQDLEIIRKYRNKVAHNKKLSKEDYDYSRKILNGFNKTLSSAINDIEERDFAQTDWRVSYKNTVNMISSMMSIISEEMQESLNELSKSMTGCMEEMIKSVNDSLKQMIPMSTQNIFKQIQESNEVMTRQLSQSFRHITQQSMPRRVEKRDNQGIYDERKEE